jgi:DNA-binding NtrC family response regulator
VLLVDAEPTEVELIATYLERPASGLDWTAETETDPAAALARIRDGEPFDCVVSDYRMPEVDSITFLQAVREHHARLPVLLFPGEETQASAARVVAAGLADYLRKGFDSEGYAMLVRRLRHAVASDEGGVRRDRRVGRRRTGPGGCGRDRRAVRRGGRRVRAAYGYTASEVEGRHWSELHPTPEVEYIRAHVLSVVQSGG